MLRRLPLGGQRGSRSLAPRDPALVALWPRAGGSSPRRGEGGPGPDNGCGVRTAGQNWSWPLRGHSLTAAQHGGLTGARCGLVAFQTASRGGGGAQAAIVGAYAWWTWQVCTPKPAPDRDRSVVTPTGCPGAPNPAGGAGVALGPTLPVALGGFASHLLPPLGPLCLPVTLTVMLGLTFHLTQRAFGDVSWQKTSSCSGDPAGDGHRPREERGLRAAAGGSCLPPGPGRSALVSSAAVAGFLVPAIHCHLRFADKGNEAQRC